MQQGLIAWEQYSVHCFGFIIDPNRDSQGRTSSVAWGSGPLYKELRNTYDSTMMKQLSDYEGMFKWVYIFLHSHLFTHCYNRALEALKAGKEYVQELYNVDLRKVHGEGERDRSRRLFGEFLRVDIRMLISLLHVLCDIDPCHHQYVSFTNNFHPVMQRKRKWLGRGGLTLLFATEFDWLVGRLILGRFPGLVLTTRTI
jgi:hypothetical protein